MPDWRFILEKWVLGKHKEHYELKVMKTVKRIHGRLFVDIGANWGMYTLRLAKNFERVYAFEPNPRTASELRKNISEHRIQNVIVYEKALGHKTGMTRLYLDASDGMGNRTDTILPAFRFRPTKTNAQMPERLYQGRDGVDVETVTYDSLIKDKVDLVKIDVEGAEFLVLEGMKESIRDGRVDAVLVELHDNSLKPHLERLFENYARSWPDPDHLLARSPTQ